MLWLLVLVYSSSARSTGFRKKDYREKAVVDDKQALNENIQ